LIFSVSVDPSSKTNFAADIEQKEDCHLYNNFGWQLRSVNVWCMFWFKRRITTAKYDNRNQSKKANDNRDWPQMIGERNRSINNQRSK